MIYTYDMLVNDLAEKFNLSANAKCTDYILLYMSSDLASRTVLTLSLLDTLTHYCCGKYQITIGEFNKMTERLVSLLKSNLKDGSLDEHLQEAMKVYRVDNCQTSTKNIH